MRCYVRLTQFHGPDLPITGLGTVINVAGFQYSIVLDDSFSEPYCHLFLDNAKHKPLCRELARRIDLGINDLSDILVCVEQDTKGCDYASHTQFSPSTTTDYHAIPSYGIF